ncbi:hypothetical protein DSO57_1025957 [Entomophthora muscae]|uniref:Uncharacterized protein n=1 Tax=Entomophthora muscae TaxID=34485 RepID=A0ACC2SRR0_9FUNG|nr:hypothetical protein DSO57_1025957 [Entomophthora muscae]
MTQIYEFHVLCLAFYQAAFALLLHVHTLKQTKCVDYQKFIKKNGKHVLLESGLSLTTVFPHMDSLSCHMLNSDTDLCEELVEDCLGLKNLKYLSLNNCLSEVPEMFSPLYGFLELLYLQSGPKRLIIDAKYPAYVLDKLNQEACKLPNEIILLYDDRHKLQLNAKNLTHTWVYFKRDYCHFYLRLPHGPGYSENMKSIGLSDVSSQNLIVIWSGRVFEKILKMPDFVEHFTACFDHCTSDIFTDEYAPNFPSLHFNCNSEFLNCKSPCQATKVSFGKGSTHGSTLYYLTCDRFSNLQNLYISDTIQLENRYSSFHRPKPFSLSIDFFPHLIRFSSKAPQADWFWPKLLQAAPKLQYIHTNYRPGNVLEIEKQRPLLQFMPYQDIFGESGDIHYMPEFIYSNR